MNKINSWAKVFNSKSIGGVYSVTEDDQLILNSMTAKQLKLMGRMISSSHNYGHHQNREHWKSMTRADRLNECREAMGKLIVLKGGAA